MIKLPGCTSEDTSAPLPGDFPHQDREHETDALVDGAQQRTFWSLNGGELEAVHGGIIEETRLAVFINGQEFATLMCSPLDQEALALGFLYNEEVIGSTAEIRHFKLNVARTTADVFMHAVDLSGHRRFTLTSGCGGGITSQETTPERPPLESNLVVTPDTIFARMRDLNDAARLYRQVRGVHTAILATPDALRLIAEDIGRHNTIDKLAGKALLCQEPMADRLLLSSGRISSEMVTKARRMGIPLIASRTAPTSAAARLAELWNICIVGYVRQRGMRVYTHPQRLGLPAIPRD